MGTLLFRNERCRGNLCFRLCSVCFTRRLLQPRSLRQAEFQCPYAPRPAAFCTTGRDLPWRNRARIHTLAMAAHLPTIYNAREFVEAGGLMSYGPNASDLFRRSADGREGGGQQAVSSLNESISFRARNAYSKTPLNSRESGIQAKDLGPCNGVPATRTSRGAPRGDEERGVVFAATREPKYPFIRCSLFGRSNPREQALWTPSIATS